MFFPFSFWNKVSSGISGTYSYLNNYLLSYYKLDNNGNDELGNYNLGPSGVVSYVPGVINTGASFPSLSNNYLSGGFNNHFTLSDQRSFSLWVYHDPTTPDLTTIVNPYISKCISDFGNVNNEYLIGSYPGGNDFRFVVWGQNGLDGVFAQTGSVYLDYIAPSFESDNVWSFMVASIDTISKDMSLTFFTGQSATGWANYTTLNYTNDAGISGGLILNTNKPFRIGANEEIASNYLGYGNHSKVDEVGVWNKVLTTNEILYLYNGGTGRTYPF